MDRLERGTRNLGKLAKIADGYSGKVTFWNPTSDDVSTLTIHQADARAITLVYDYKLNAEQQEVFRNRIATVSGYIKMLNLSWANVHYGKVEA